MSDPRFDPETICRHLRCKEMFAQGENSEHRKLDLFDSFEATAFWCSKTQTGRGPDGERVGLADCSAGCSRPCFLGIHSLA